MKVILGALLLAVAGGTTGYDDTPLPEHGSAEWKRLFAVDIAVDALGSSPIPRPESAARYEVTFKGELAGFNIGRVFLDTEISDDGYAVEYRMEQNGIASWFSDAEARSTGIGTFGDTGEVNGFFYKSHDYEGEDDQKRVEFIRLPGDRRLRWWREPTYEFRESIDEDLAWGAVDPMAALISLGFPAVEEGKHPCDRSIKVIEGRLRYDLFFTPDGTKRLRNRGKGRFRGDAYRCKLSLKQVAGYREKDRQKEADGNVEVFLVDVPEPFRTAQFAYVPIEVRVSRGLISGKLEAKRPTITGPDGQSICLGRKC